MKRKHTATSGLTLVEVIVVLVVLTALVAVSIPALSGWVDNAGEKRCLAEMGMVRSDYAAHAVYAQFKVSDGATAGLLSSAVSETLDRTSAGFTYPDYQGNTCTVLYGKENLSIAVISCAKHGSLSDAGAKGLLATAKAPSDFLSEALRAKRPGEQNRNIISGGIDSNAAKQIEGYKDDDISRAHDIKAYLAAQGIDFDAMNIRTWRIKGGKPLDQATMYWTDQDITGKKERDPVNVLVYDAATGKYQTGTTKVWTNKYDLNNQPYAYLGDTITFADNTKYDTYADAVAAFNAMPEP